LNALVTDPIVECVTWETMDSCAEGYRISNLGLKLCNLCQEGYTTQLVGTNSTGCRSSGGSDPKPTTKTCDAGKFWDKPKYLDGAKCVSPTEDCAAGYAASTDSTKATSDCIICAGEKVLSAISTDNIGKCIDFVDFNSCEVGYKIDNSG
jgi:hypothetical protein